MIKMQRAAGRWLAQCQKAACVLQTNAKKFLLLIRQRRMEQGIIKAQVLWRAYQARRLHNRPQVVAIRQRLQSQYSRGG